MPNLADTPTNSIVKMLIIGDSGSGKTGALSSLVDKGYKLRILDFDRGLDPLSSFVEDKSKLKNVEYFTLTDAMTSRGNKIIPKGTPNAVARGTQLLNYWAYDKDNQILSAKKAEEAVTNLGPAESWGDDTIIVLDSLTFMCAAAMRYVMAINGRAGEHPWQSDWGEAMRISEDFLALLYSDAIKCHVIVTSHITYVEPEGGLTKGYPSALGQKLPPKIGRYFNTLVLAETKGGKESRRVIRTQSKGVIELKTPVKGIASELPLPTALATLFKEIRNG